MIGALPAVPILLAIFAEGTWAWFDPDLFMSLSADRDTDELVLRINNYFQDLWRSALGAGIPVTDPAMRRLDGSMAAWVDFKRQYDDALFKPPVFGRDWEGELEEWRQEWLRRRDDLQKVAADELQQQLAERGIDPTFVKAEEPGLVDRVSAVLGETIEEAGRESRRSMMLPMIGVGVFGIAMVWIVARASQPSRA